MKNIKILFLVVFSYFTSYAQNPQLFENDWYLQKVIIDGVEHLPPFSNVIGRLYFNLDTVEVVNPFCEEGFSSTIDYVPNSNFNIDDGGNVLVGTCTNPDIIQYGIYHFSIYHNLNNSIAKNPFSYSFLDNNGILELTIVNTDGDIAIYGNELLSNLDFENTSFELYPNPAQDVLSIENTSTYKITSIRLYNVLGRLVLVEKETFSQLNVSNLNSGLLFVEIETDEGTLTKKIIKK